MFVCHALMELISYLKLIKKILTKWFYNKHLVPDGTSENYYLFVYQHIVPNGTVPEGLNIGRI